MYIRGISSLKYTDYAKMCKSLRFHKQMKVHQRILNIMEVIG